MRVIVAGSKDWPYPTVVHRALRLCADAARSRAERLTVAHGHLKTGAEAQADAWTSIASCDRYLTVDPPERWPARWTDPCRKSCARGHRRRYDGDERTRCPSAGFFRTDDMFAAAPVDLLLLFVAEDRRRPEYALQLAQQHSITYQEFTP